MSGVFHVVWLQARRVAYVCELLLSVCFTDVIMFYIICVVACFFFTIEWLLLLDWSNRFGEHLVFLNNSLVVSLANLEARKNLFYIGMPVDDLIFFSFIITLITCIRFPEGFYCLAVSKVTWGQSLGRYPMVSLQVIFNLSKWIYLSAVPKDGNSWLFIKFCRFWRWSLLFHNFCLYSFLFHEIFARFDKPIELSISVEEV